MSAHAASSTARARSAAERTLAIADLTRYMAEFSTDDRLTTTQDLLHLVDEGEFNQLASVSRDTQRTLEPMRARRTRDAYLRMFEWVEARLDSDRNTLDYTTLVIPIPAGFRSYDHGTKIRFFTSASHLEARRQAWTQVAQETPEKLSLFRALIVKMRAGLGRGEENDDHWDVARAKWVDVPLGQSVTAFEALNQLSGLRGLRCAQTYFDRMVMAIVLVYGMREARIALEMVRVLEANGAYPDRAVVVFQEEPSIRRLLTHLPEATGKSLVEARAEAKADYSSAYFGIYESVLAFHQDVLAERAARLQRQQQLADLAAQSTAMETDAYVNALKRMLEEAEKDLPEAKRRK